MQIHGYNAFGSIDLTLDGERLSVPDDMKNRHRQMVAEWEENGNTIPAYEAPAPDLYPNLEPDQFWFGLRVSGHEAALRTWVASLNNPESPEYDPVAWAAASAKLEFAKYFERDHPLVEAAREAIGMSETELDDLWRYAAS